jgi:hypothetical protein
MNTLIPQLIDILKRIEPAAGADAESLRGLLRNFAAEVIQSDPSQGVILPGDIPLGDLGPRLVEAIQAGIEFVAVLDKTSTLLHVFEEELPHGTPAIGDSPEQASETFGPFVERGGTLIRLKAFRSGAFLRVLVHNPPGIPIGPNELQILIPAASTPDAPDLLNWTLAPGTVWIASRFLVKGTTDFTGLRIKGGTMRLGGASRTDAVNIQLPPGQSFWSLSLEPEATPPSGAGSDADALALTLPTRLDVSSPAPPVVSGAPILSGFGSDIHFTMSGAPHTAASQILFPMQAAEPTWSITGNASGLATFSGESAVASADYALTISTTGPDFLAEAAHGGSLVVRLGTPFSSSFAAQQGGVSNWLQTTLTANALQLELHSGDADSAAAYDLDLWNTSHSAVRFAGQSLSGLVFRSERGAGDTVVVLGGAIRNQWDLPCGANGQPFPFEGRTDSFGLFSNAAGTWVAVSATASVLDSLNGLTLENLHLVVKSPRKLFALAPFDTAPQLSSGIAIFQFDVNFAVPTLPDPYAANFPLPEFQGVVESALGIRLTWQGASTPALLAYLLLQVHFPEPPFLAPAGEDEQFLRGVFQVFLMSSQLESPEFLYLLDMSSSEHLLGMALESPSNNQAELLDNRLSLPMQHVRLLMQPQVQWEPVLIEKNPLIPSLQREIVHSTSNGGPTLIGANSVTLVPTLPKPVAAGILNAISLEQPSAVLFSLPFGLRAVVRLSSQGPFFPQEGHPAIAATELHEPVFGTFSVARQFRITAVDNGFTPPQESGLPGLIRQTPNLDLDRQFNIPKLTSVLPDELAGAVDGFSRSVVIPVQHADLSGYGLSSFSQWISTVDGFGLSKAEFQVMNGRTAYEVLMFRSCLYECGARVVRTIILERHTSGRVSRSDSGWVAVEPGVFALPQQFANGSVRAFKNIRRIRITGAAAIPLDANTSAQPVIFDADADIDGHDGLVPIYDRPGYIQIEPSPPQSLRIQNLLTDTQLRTLFSTVGPIGSPVDCVIRLGNTLEMHLSAIVSDVAPDEADPFFGFAVAVVGSPKLPRAGQWNVVRINPQTNEVSPVDPRRGVPVTRVVPGPFRFREPSDARRSDARIRHGLLLSTESSRVLFGRPIIDLSKPPGTLNFEDVAVMADPYSLVQATGHFPNPSFAISLDRIPLFNIDENNQWRIDNPIFDVPNLVKAPAAGLMKGADWGISRGFGPSPPRPPGLPQLPGPSKPQVNLNIDSAAAQALNIAIPTSHLDLDLPAPLNTIFKLHADYATIAGQLPKLGKPTLEFTGLLEELKKTLDSLAQLVGLPFDVDVSVTANPGESPSFVVHLHLNFRLGKSPEDRIDVGAGKFYGEFTIEGELEAGLTGINRSLLSVALRGDMQQGILPPLLYAGGFFTFSIELRDTGSPTIQMGLGVIFSIGGDLIPGLIAVEVTVHYGYTLIPDTLEPGALIGLDAHAKLLGGLIGFSFAVEAMARIKRPLDDPQTITIWAHIRVAASVHVAIFLDEDIDFETQFQQKIPLAALSLIPGAGIIPALVQAVTLL